MIISLKVSTQSKVLTAENTVNRLYKTVSFSKNNTPHWDDISSIFHPDANIIVRKSPKEILLLSIDEFIKLWKDDIIKYKLKEKGFTEEVITIKTEVFGEIAYGHVIYQASVPDSERPPQFGIDCIHLVKNDGDWKIISIINEALRPGVEPFSEQRNDFNNYINDLKHGN